MSDLSRVCEELGYIVDGETPIPDDPSDYGPPDVKHTPPCNQLRCRGCGARVRNRAKVQATEDISDRAGELYETQDWTSLQYIKSSARRRLYACRCTVYVCFRQTPMYDDDPDPLDHTTFPWGCAGHPDPVLPINIDGAQINCAEDVATTVRALLSGWKPNQAGIGDWPTEWLPGLHARLSPLPAADLVGRTLAEQADKHLGAAIDFFHYRPEAAGSGQMVDFLRGDLELAAASHLVTPRAHDWWRSAPMFLAMQAGKHQGARDLIRTVLGDGLAELDEELVKVLVKTDAEWLAQNATTQFEGHPELVKTLLDGYGSSDRWELAVVAGISLVKQGGSAGEAAGAWANLPWIKKRAAGFAILAVL
jgi:hypothetical protein